MWLYKLIVLLYGSLWRLFFRTICTLYLAHKEQWDLTVYSTSKNTLNHQLHSPIPLFSPHLGLLHLILMLIWEPPAPFHQDTLCPDCLIVFRCRSFPLQKGKNKVEPEGYNANCWTPRKGEGMWWLLARRAGSRHTSQEVTLAMLDYNVHSLLLQSSLWNIPLLPQPQGWRVWKEEWFHLSLFYIASIQRAA